MLWLLCAAALFAAGAAEAELAPLNPAFYDYITKVSSDAPSGNRMAGSSAGDAGGRNFGYIPSPLDWSHLDGKVYSISRSSAEGTDLRSALVGHGEKHGFQPAMISAPRCRPQEIRCRFQTAGSTARWQPQNPV